MRKRFVVAIVALAVVMAVGCGGSGVSDQDIRIIPPDAETPDQGQDASVNEDSGNTGRDGNVTDTQVPVDVAGDGTEPSDEGGDSVVPADVPATDTNEVVVPKCWLGQDECQPLTSTDRKTCDNAQILGRFQLATDIAIKLNSDTINEKTGGNTDADNLDGDCRWFPGDDDPLYCQSVCKDDGLDHFFRVYLVPGDLFSFTVTDYLVFNSEDYYGTHIDFMVKVYKGAECPLNTDRLLSCTNEADSSSRATYNNVQIKPTTDAEGGWYTIVLDSVDKDNAGTYTVEARLMQNSEYTGDWNLCCDFPSY